MSWQDDSFTDVRLTGQEASRLLSALEQDSVDDSIKNATKSAPGSSNSASSGLQTPAISKPEGSSCSGLVFFCLVLMVGLGLFIVHVLNDLNGSLSSDNAELGFQASCGSKSSSTGRWWPVLGIANRSLLLTVKDSYCGDAYINEDGVMQVASFATKAEARVFAEQLSRATRSRFRVGQG